MSRRVYLLGVGLALVALALAVTDWALSLRPGVTEANVRRIRVGMTLAEVEGILGGPGRPLPPSRPFCAPYKWSGDAGLATVVMGMEGDESRLRVAFAYWLQSAGAPANPFARLRAWLGW
jgi:hypothetical protein